MDKHTPSALEQMGERVANAYAYPEGTNASRACDREALGALVAEIGQEYLAPLLAEVERLRGALGEIAALESANLTGGERVWLGPLVALARAALKEGGPR